jgi:hypothetical protein
VKLWRWSPVVLLAVLIGFTAIARMSTETKQGVGFVQSTFELPLYEKTVDFVQRDLSYARLVKRIVGDQASAEARALTLFDWTRENVRDVPEGFPIVDDHVSHIIIRGYGQVDQKADVFTTLTTYAGVPGTWGFGEPPSPALILSFVWIERAWRVFDVENEIVFRNRSGALASADELGQDPWVLNSVAVNRTYLGKPYASYFEGYRPPNPQDVLRAELQMLWPRASYRLKRFLGLGRREWQTAR